jgi:signal transduction histidine kinase
MIRILLANLIGNAAKFTGKVEKASIEVGRLPSEDGGFFVKDNGAGFDQAFAASIFKPFERLHRESEFKGTGIGLATCAKIIRRHGGKIWIESELGCGATVSFVLPIPDRTVNGSSEQEDTNSAISSSAR